MFQYSDFDRDISYWDVSSVGDMERMFYYSSFNQSIGVWDVSSVTTMTSMFAYATDFDQPLDNWDVGKVETMRDMFYGPYDGRPRNSFNQCLSTWAAKVPDNVITATMFYYASCPGSSS